MAWHIYGLWKKASRQKVDIMTRCYTVLTSANSSEEHAGDGASVCGLSGMTTSWNMHWIERLWCCTEPQYLHLPRSQHILQCRSSTLHQSIDCLEKMHPRSLAMHSSCWYALEQAERVFWKTSICVSGTLIDHSWPRSRTCFRRMLAVRFFKGMAWEAWLTLSYAHLSISGEQVYIDWPIKHNAQRLCLLTKRSTKRQRAIIHN